MMYQYDLITPSNLKYIGDLLGLTEVTKNKLLIQEYLREDVVKYIFGVKHDTATQLLSALYNTNCIRRAENQNGMFYKTGAFVDWLRSTTFDSKEFRLSDIGAGTIGVVEPQTKPPA
jgi:hypothetical protein